LLGTTVRFYSVNNSILENSSFNYSFPITFTSGISSKDKLTYLVWIDDSNDVGVETEFNGIGDAFDLDFVNSQNNFQKTKIILDFLKPDYLIFEYITTYTKNLFGL
jgi:hypothetical protein